MTKENDICVITLSGTESESDDDETKTCNDQDNRKIEDETNTNKSGGHDTITLDDSADIVVLDNSSVVEDTLPFKIDKTGSSKLPKKLPEFIPIRNLPRVRKRYQMFSRCRKPTQKQQLQDKSSIDTSVEFIDVSTSNELDSTADSRLKGSDSDGSAKLEMITKSNSSSTGTKNKLCNLKKAIKRLTNQGVQNSKITTTTEKNSKKKKKLKKQQYPRKIKIISLTQSNASIPKRCTKGFRPIIIDGLNVAYGHGVGEFSFKGIVIVVEYFESRGHDEIVCFLPHHYQALIDSDPGMEIIKKRFEKDRILTYTPSRVINGKRVSPYDDRYIIQYATERQGIIITNDAYKDLLMEADWKETIEQRVLNFTFTREGGLMLPRDPLGSEGPTLDEMLKFPES